MEPVTIAILIAVGAVAANIVAYFLVSKKAKERAARFGEKAALALKLLKERIERMEQLLTKAREAQARAESDAAEARQRGAEAEVAWQQAERRARDLDALCGKLRRDIERLHDEKVRWTKESETAGELQKLAGSKVTMATAIQVRELVLASAILSKHTVIPANALRACDDECAALDRTSSEMVRLHEQAFEMITR